MSTSSWNKKMLIPSILLIVVIVLSACAPQTAPAASQPTSAGEATKAVVQAQPTATTAAAEPTKGPEPTLAAESTEPSGVLMVKEGNVQQWTRNFNPFMTQPPAVWASTAAMYEPLLIYSQTTSKYIPWLATGYTWSGDATVLTYDIRSGVLWSDGQPFSAKDVAFTYNLLKEFPALDTGGIWKNLESVSAENDTTVKVKFNTVYVAGLTQISQVPIVPEHIWKDVADPTTFTNETPVVTGPFSVISEFKDQVFQIDRNPNYWQEGKPYIKAIRLPIMGEDAYFLSLGKGEWDWGAAFVPDIQKTFSEKDPEHFKWWAPGIGNSTFLYLNTTRKPFDDVRVRKAISMALDRDLMINTALYGYSSKDDATALSESLNAFKDPKIIDTYKDLVTLNIEKANALLDEAGLKKGPNGMRTLPDGSPWKVYADNAGWADYAAISQIVAQNLKAVGIDAEARAFNADAWFDKVFKGDFDMTIGWSATGATPYETYRGLMSSATVKPIGETSGENWHRFQSAKADELLAELAKQTEFEKQKELAYQLQQVFVDEFPAVPIYSQGVLVQYNTTKFTGFPDAETPYVSPATYNIPESLIVLTTLKPVK